MGKLVSELSRIIEGDLNGSMKSKWVNVLKMTTFIACKLTEALEAKYHKASADILVTGRVSNEQLFKVGIGLGEITDNSAKDIDQKNCHRNLNHHHCHPSHNSF